MIFVERLKTEYQKNLEECLEGEDYELEVRNWYMDHFRLTPFDEKYLAVPWEWLEYSYIRFFNNPSYEAIRDHNVNTKATEKADKEHDEGIMENLEQFGGFENEDMMKSVLKTMKEAR